MVLAAKVYERTQDAAISFRERGIKMLPRSKFSYEHVKMPDDVSELSGREGKQEYLDRLAGKVLLRFGSRFIVAPIGRLCHSGSEIAKIYLEGYPFCMRR